MENQCLVVVSALLYLFYIFFFIETACSKWIILLLWLKMQLFLFINKICNKKKFYDTNIIETMLAQL